MKYQEYLNQPGMMDRFNVKYNELKDYFNKRFEKVGIGKVQNDILSMKVAMIDADYIFSEQFNSENQENGETKTGLNNN
ncbi:MAG: hypothetical protein ACHQJ4_06040 [Ignavibacteria bacterium]